jgi:hypothetical protein
MQRAYRHILIWALRCSGIRYDVFLIILLLFCFSSLHILMPLEQSELLRGMKLKAEDDGSYTGNDINQIRFNKFQLR